MATALHQPNTAELPAILDGLREWQYEGAPMQLHPGDVGWYWVRGARATAAALRTWRRDGRLIAVGLLDGPRLLRITTAPDMRRDDELARQVSEDVADPRRGVLPAGEANIEAPSDALLQDVLAEHGWGDGEAWTPLRRDLSEPVADPGVRVVVTDADQVPTRTAVHRAAFGSPHFTDDLWHTMAAGPAYADARCLVAYDDQDEAVGAVTVWSAGPGRPGLLEPMGVHPDHRGHGHGTAVNVAAAAALRQLGSSSAIVGTPSSNAAGVSAYVSAGFNPRREVRDRYRAA